MKKNFLQLIENEQINELHAQVFNQKLPNSDGEGTYTEVLNLDEEVALMRKLLSKTDYEADPWLEFVQEYSSHYPMRNEAIDVLLENKSDPRAIPLMIDILKRSTYNERQGLAICNLIVESKDQEQALLLLQFIYSCGRVFSEEIYRKLELIDSRIKSLGYEDQAHFADAYKQSVENYAKDGKK